MPLSSLPASGWISLALFFALVTLCVKPMGYYMVKVFKGKPTLLTPILSPLETAACWLCGRQATCEMDWKTYLTAVLSFSFSCIVFLFMMVWLQEFPNIPPDLALNIAVSFVTNTGWQSYVPETSLTPLTQTLGVMPQAALSGGVGLAVMIAVIRGFADSNTASLGNFWVDLIRAMLYIILPVSLLFALFYVSQGALQSFSAYLTFSTLETNETQTILSGPVASFTSIKLLTASGGGYYAANAAHPFENPTPLSNFVQMLNMLLIQVGATFLFGKFVGDPRQGRSIYISMLILFIPFMLFAAHIEQAGNPLLPEAIDQSLGQMEGKELRIGSWASCLWAALTTATANGSTNASLDSFLPLSGMVPIIFMHFGEVVFGGAGSGLYSMLVYVLVTVFIASLMIGRSPSFLGKKIGVFEIQMSAIIIMIPALLSLLGTAAAVTTEAGRLAATNPGPQGFNQIFYAFSSSAANNGSSFAGIESGTPFYNTLLELGMLIGRYGIIAAVLALAGSMGQKTRANHIRGHLDTTTGTFVLLLVAVVILIDFLTFIPSLAIGSLAGHFELLRSAL